MHLTYEQAKLQLETKHRNELAELVKEYALAQNPYKTGDVIRDHSCTIRIINIKTTTSFSKPTCVYKGIELKNDGTPKKARGLDSNVYSTIWQTNIIE